ncbi:hypothetical protein ACP4J4_10495 [Aureimonas ureilytica]|uniref:hypothetical protein n=1 Tax=Aureimonas ureilytica TaxID=401562 RepID=UPI003CF1E24F
MSYESEKQEILDRLYHQRGPCCAGCDWWQHMNSMVGNCTRSVPVSGEARADMLGITFTTRRPPAGHVMTMRDHVCGEFKDTFDWKSLPLSYQKRIGAA